MVRLNLGQTGDGKDETHLKGKYNASTTRKLKQGQENPLPCSQGMHQESSSQVSVACPQHFHPGAYGLYRWVTEAQAAGVTSCCLYELLVERGA